MTRLLIFLTLTTLLGCKDQKEPTPTLIDTEPGSMKITVDGITMVSSPKSPAHANLLNTGVGFLIGYFEVSDNLFAQVVIQISDTKVGLTNVRGNVNSPPYPDTYCYYYPIDNLGIYYSYQLTESNAGSINITELDRTKKIISGTFEGKMARSNDPKVVTITKGYFKQIPIQ